MEGRSKLLYTMSEYPSVSETFVVNEAAAVTALGIPVVGYALKQGPASRSASPIKLICQPATRLQLLAAAIRSAPTIAADIGRARRERLTVGEIARWLLATAHAAYIVDASKELGVTHIHAHFLGRSADVASLLAPLLGCEWTATAHASDVYAPGQPGLMRRRLRTVAAVACANRGLRERLDRFVTPAELRTGTVHCGVNTHTLKFGPSRPADGARHLVTVGRLVATKGYWTILESAIELMRGDLSLRWTIVGDGPLRNSLAHDARFVELFPRMKLVRALDHADILTLLGRATAFVLPCEQSQMGDSDGIPVALMEAMALGVPVVTTATGGILELVVPNETGFIVEPKDAPGLVETLKELLYTARPSEIDRIRVAARRKVELEFDLFLEAQALLELLKPYLET